MGVVLLLVGAALLIPNNIVIRAVGVAAILIAAGFIYPMLFRRWIERSGRPKK